LRLVCIKIDGILYFFRDRNEIVGRVIILIFVVDEGSWYIDIIAPVKANFTQDVAVENIVYHISVCSVTLVSILAWALTTPACGATHSAIVIRAIVSTTLIVVRIEHSTNVDACVVFYFVD